jgi:hypothetical protein
MQPSKRSSLKEDVTQEVPPKFLPSTFYSLKFTSCEKHVKNEKDKNSGV